MLKAAGIRMEYEKSPVGLAELPWFGWTLESDRKNVKQERFWLQLALDGDFAELVYDSGWVESAKSAHVCALANRLSPTGETALLPCRRYFARVRAADGAEESDWSGTASFVTGLTDVSQWKARFVSAETEQGAAESRGTLLRRAFTVRPGVKEAYVCATALGLYQLFLNGDRVGEDELTPGWTSYEKHLCYQTYDVTDLLREGENALGAHVGAGWYKGKMGFLHRRNNYGGRTALLLQLTVRYLDGTQETFCTDESWRGAFGPVLFSEIYDGETVDSSLEPAGWKEPGFDDGAWKPVSAVSFPMEALTAQAAGKVGVMERIPAKRVFTTPNGETVVDFGQNLTGWPELTVCGEKSGEAVVQCFETLDAAGNVYTANLRTAKQTFRCRLSGGEETFRPHFTFMGFQYLHIQKWPGEPKAEDFTALVLHSRMEPTGTFSCSDELVNRLSHNILWGLKGNFVDIPTDCPQRDERMGWTGDAQIFCRTACWLMNTYTFYRKWLRDVAADQTPEGGVPHVVPDIISGHEEGDWLLSQGTHSAAAWADVIVINPWTMYLVYGDKEILAERYEGMKKWVNFMRAHARDNIWNYRLQFGDWVALDAEEGSYFGATPNDLTCTAYYAYSTGLFAKIAATLGKEEDAREYAALYETIRETFRKTFFLPDGTMTAQTQTAHIAALYFDLVPGQFRAQTAKRLTELLDEHGGHLVTGFVGTPYFCHALSENGYADRAYELLLKEDFPSWLYQVKMGATTVWEHWDGKKPDGTMWSPDMNSFNHYAYGAVGDWLYRVVLGVELDERAPGYRHTTIRPVTGNAFSFAEGSLMTMYGRLSVRWERDGALIRLHLTIPHNTTASIRLEPGGSPVGTDGLVFTEEDGVWTAPCGSGEWNLSYRKER